MSVWELDLAPKVASSNCWQHLVGQFLSADGIIQASYMITVLVVYGVYTGSFSLDRPLGLHPRALSELGVYSINHSQLSYNYNQEFMSRPKGGRSVQLRGTAFESERSRHFPYMDLFSSGA